MNFGDEDDKGPVLTKRRKPINRKTKVQVVFDEKARREFLTGFRKRKLQRKKKAQEELKQMVKEEKKRIKEKSKEEYKKMVKTYQPIPELEERMAQLHEVKNCTVSILELDSDLLAENNFIIGRNRVKYDEPEEDNEETPIKSEEDDDPFSCKIKIDNPDKPDLSEQKGGVAKELKTKKELKKDIKKQATRMVKKSNAFKQLNKIQQIKQKKKSNRKKNIIAMKLDKKNKKRSRKRIDND